MLALQELVPAAEAAFEPILLEWIVLLPLLGFVINGALSIVAARRAHPAAHDADLRHDHVEEEDAPAEGSHAGPVAAATTHDASPAFRLSRQSPSSRTAVVAAV